MPHGGMSHGGMPAGMPPARMPAVGMPQDCAHAGASASASPSALRLPGRLHEALQHEVPYPQLVTERSPPYKIIHTNAAWRSVTGHGVDELVGKPYQTLLSPTDVMLHHLLQRAFASAQQARSRRPPLPAPAPRPAGARAPYSRPCCEHARP